jgi:MFS family permease
MATEQLSSEKVVGRKRNDSFFTRNYVLTCLAAFSFFFSANIVTPALPLYVQNVGGNQSEVGIVLSLHSVVALFSRSFVGQLIDKGFVTGLLAFGGMANLLSSISLIFFTAILLIAGSRVLMGLGMSALATAAGASVADAAPLARRGEAVGIYALVGPLSTALAPAIGMAILSRTGFTALFVLSGVMALVSLILSTQIKMPKKARTGPVPLQIFNKDALLPALVLSFGTFATGAMFAFVPLYVTNFKLGDPGLFFTVYAGSMVLVRMVTGRLSDIHGRIVVLVPGVLVMGLSSLFLATMPGYWGLLAAGAVMGGGLGATFPAVMALAIDRALITERGSATATTMAAFDLGASTGTLIDGFILQSGGFSTMFGVNGIMPIVGVVLFLLLNRRWRPRHSAANEAIG